MANLIFYILAVIALASALMVVTRKNAITSAVCLVVTMCTIAGLFVQLGAIFVAALQIIVYAGAIMVLFLFVIMLLNLRKDEFGFDARVFQRLFAVLLGVIFLIQMVLIVSRLPVKPGQPIDTEMGKVAPLSTKLFTQYLYPFEITSVLLLAAIIGAVVIAKRKMER
jgi:NADH-quinone oxidoreductase subunit J